MLPDAYIVHIGTIAYDANQISIPNYPQPLIDFCFATPETTLDRSS